MRSMLHRRVRLALPLAPLLVAAGCSPTLVRLSPASADLVVEPKPVMPEAAITDDTAAAQYSSDVEAWGETGWAQVARLCRWASSNKLTNVVCPKP